jgi:GNAT superfamily N-acetyltransferase
VTPDELLTLYDTQVRGSFPDRLPVGWTGERDGPLTRCLHPHGGFTMLAPDARGLSADDLEALVDRTFAFFAERAVEFEWKTFDHDRADLVPLLVERGATPQEHEALVLGETAELAAPVVLPEGLALREVAERADLDRIAAMESQVWDDDWGWLADDLASRLQEEVPATVCVVEDGGTVVSAAWLAPFPGTEIAGLWGGSTLAAYRGRGIYRALVAHRANVAQRLGYRLLQVDASDDSRPILTRLGLQVVGGTTPYVTAPGAMA